MGSKGIIVAIWGGCALIAVALYLGLTHAPTAPPSPAPLPPSAVPSPSSTVPAPQSPATSPSLPVPLPPVPAPQPLPPQGPAATAPAMQPAGAAVHGTQTGLPTAADVEALLRAELERRGPELARACLATLPAGTRPARGFLLTFDGTLDADGAPLAYGIADDPAGTPPGVGPCVQRSLLDLRLPRLPGQVHVNVKFAVPGPASPRP